MDEIKQKIEKKTLDSVIRNRRIDIIPRNIERLVRAYDEEVIRFIVSYVLNLQQNEEVPLKERLEMAREIMDTLETLITPREIKRILNEVHEVDRTEYLDQNMEQVSGVYQIDPNSIMNKKCMVGS